MSKTINVSKNEDPLFDSRVDLVAAGMPVWIRNRLKTIKREQAETLIRYVEAMQTEFNPQPNTTTTIFRNLIHFSTKLEHKPFIEMTRDDIIFYLNTYRKSEEKDPSHKWIGTYNTKRRILVKFFKWLYYPDTNPKDRQRPPCVQNLRDLKRKTGESIYTANDMWTPQDDVLFFKYCPDKRIKCFHAMDRDTSARPGELLKLTIADVLSAIHTAPSGIQYGQVTVGQKTSHRPVPIINSIPYIKEWVNEHPMRGNPNAPLFCNKTGKNMGRPLTGNMLYRIYVYEFQKGYRNGKKQWVEGYFPRLLKDPSVPPEDKLAIEKLLLKRWNPYVRRHTGLTEKRKKLPGPLFHQYSGHTLGSKVPEMYTHLFGSEACETMFEIEGVIQKDPANAEILKPKPCPNCRQPNALDAQYCSSEKCRMPLNIEAHMQVTREKEKMEQKLKDMIRQQLEELLLERYGKKS